jgi:hypothetical protein
VFQRWMVSDCALQSQDLAVAFNFASECFRSVEGLACLSQHFEPAAVFDLVFGREPVP